jgi:hypothetical protein
MRSKHENSRGSVIGTWLRSSRRKVTADFANRAASSSRTDDPPILKRGRRLGTLLSELAMSLRRGRVIHEPIAWTGRADARPQTRPDLDAVIREVLILRECVLDGIDARHVPLAEARVVIDWFDAVAAEAREARATARLKKLRDQNQRLLVLFDVLLDAIDPQTDGGPDDAKRKADRLSILAVDLRALEADASDEPQAERAAAGRRLRSIPGGK